MSRRARRRAGPALSVPPALLRALEALHGPLDAPATITRLASAVTRLQHGLTQDRDAFRGGAYLEAADLRAAYQTYYLCANAPKLWPALARLAPRLPQALRVLELGGGPGTGVAGVGLWARETGRTVRHRLTDRRTVNLTAAQALARQLDLPLSVAALDLLAPPADVGPPADLALLMNVVNELPDSADAAVAALLARAVQPDGVVLVIEPAAAEPSRRALALRDTLVADGWVPLAPCPHAGPCPALAAGDWCHGAWAFDRPAFMAAIDAKVGTRRDLLQATWFALSRQPSPPVTGRAALVVAEPRQEKGRTRARVCLDDGQLSHLELQKRDRGPDNRAFEGAGLHATVRFDEATPTGADTLRLTAQAKVEVTP